MEASNRGACADASAAPRASASSASSGALTGRAVAISICDLTAATSTPEPTMKTPCGGDCISSRRATIAASSATASALCRLWVWTLTIDPSAVSMTASVASSCSMSISAVRS